MKTNRQVTMEISYHNKNYKPIDPQSIGPIKATKDGIYWFTSLKSYVFGEIHVKFSVVADGNEAVADYMERIIVDRDENGDENTEEPDNLSEEETETAVKKKTAPKKKSKEQATNIVIHFDDIEDDESIESPPPKKKAAKKKRAESFASDSTEAPQEKKKATKKKRAESFASDAKEEVKVEEVKPAKKKSRPKKKATPAVEFLPDIILPESVVAPSAARHRLYRSPLFDSDTGKIQKVALEGATLSITLPLSLNFALQDDECKVQTNFMLFQEGKLHEDSGEDMGTLYYDRPSANQLFLRLASKMSHIVDSASIINQLRMLFEYSFEDWVLFSQERELLEDRLSSIKSNQEKFGDHFGAYYYLRFFVFYTMLADTPESQGGESSSRGNDRQYKSLFAKAQEVVNYAIKDMDDNAPKYFA